MSKTLNPVDFALGMPAALLRWAQSVHDTVNNKLDFGTPLTQDSTGNFNTFAPGNNNGVLIRIGASGGSGNKYNWTTSTAPVAILHGLGRQPIGAHLVSSDKALTIWLPTTPTTTTLSIAPSDATANATIYVF